MAIRNVPQPYATISAAIAAASSGDIIQIAAAYAGNESVSVTVDNLTFGAPVSVTGIVLTAAPGIAKITLINGASVQQVGSPIQIIGNAGDNEFVGNGGANIISDGGGGNDTLRGGGGDDTISVTGGSDTVDGGDGGNDLLVIDYSSATAGVTATGITVTDNGTRTVHFQNFERLHIIAGSGDDTLTAFEGNSILEGGDGNDTFTSWSNHGTETVLGGAGDDIFRIYGGGGTVDGGTGTDTVRAGDLDRFTFVNVEMLDVGYIGYGVTGSIAQFKSFRSITQSGSAADSRIRFYLEGASGTLDFSTGLVGAHSVDVYTYGTLYGTTIIGTAGDDRLVGPGPGSVLDGGAGNDILSIGDLSHGGAGDDTISGGDGQTATYFDAGGGVRVNLLKTTAQDTLSAGVDTLKGITGLIGSAFDDQLTGNVKANRFDGGAGDDTLSGGGGGDVLDGMAGIDHLAGGSGDDTLSGGGDNDRLDGGTGSDLLFGGAGNDTYIVDDAGDVVREDITAGADDGGTVDLVQASVSFTLGAFVERLVLTGSAAIDGTGNDLANQITGNGGANHLQGMGGNDILIASGKGADFLDGGEGSDVFYVDNSDTVHDTGTTGADTIVSAGGYTLTAGSAVENLMIKAGTTNAATLTGDALANRLTGNDGDNSLRGLAGNDILQGGLGNDKLQGGLGRDTLTGGEGTDIFIFNSGDSPATNPPLAFDTLNDFATGVDKIDLDFIGGGGLVASAYAEVAIGSNGFPAVLSAASGAMADGLHSVVFVAGSTDGWLLWNTDGDMTTPDQAVRLVGQNNLADFARTDLI